MAGSKMRWSIFSGSLIGWTKRNSFMGIAPPKILTSSLSIEWFVQDAMVTNSTRWRLTNGNSLSPLPLRNTSNSTTNLCKTWTPRPRRQNNAKILSTVSKWQIVWIFWSKESRYLWTVPNARRSRSSFQGITSRPPLNISWLSPTGSFLRSGCLRSWMLW